MARKIRKLDTLDNIVSSIIDATADTFTPFWALAFHAAFEMTGTNDERASVVMSAYARIRGDAPEGKRQMLADSSVRQLIACARLWADAVRGNDTRMAAMHPFTAYAHRAAAKGTDGKRLEGDALGTAYDGISGTPTTKQRDSDGLVTIRVTTATKERLTAIAKESDLDVPTLVAAILDTYGNTSK